MARVETFLSRVAQDLLTADIMGLESSGPIEEDGGLSLLSGELIPLAYQAVGFSLILVSLGAIVRRDPGVAGMSFPTGLAFMGMGKWLANPENTTSQDSSQ